MNYTDNGSIVFGTSVLHSVRFHDVLAINNTQTSFLFCVTEYTNIF